MIIHDRVKRFWLPGVLSNFCKESRSFIDELQ